MNATTNTTTMNVIDSNLGRIPEGTTLTVTRDHTNQYTGRRVLTVEADPMPEGRISSFQLLATDTKDVFKEIVTGREGDTLLVSK